MDPDKCRRNTIAFCGEFTFQETGEATPKFFILLDDIDEETDKTIIVTFTGNLKYRDKPFNLFVPPNSFDNCEREPFPRKNSLIDCNTCREVSGRFLRSGMCKFIGRIEDGWMKKIYQTIGYATKVEPRLIIKLKNRVNLI